MTDHDEKILVAGAMIKYGGSFISSLGEALMHADKVNASKIRNTWPKEWEHYAQVASRNLRRGIDL